MAWLHATPKTRAGKPGEVTRLQDMQARGMAPDLPLPGPAAYLLDHLWSAGPITSLGMASAPLSWLDLTAWQQLMGIDLTPWEARTLRTLSGAYLAQLHEAQDPDAPPPYAPLVTSSDRREQVSRTVGQIFGGRSAAPAGPKGLVRPKNASHP